MLKKNGVKNVRSIRWLLLGISFMLVGFCFMHDPHTNIGVADDYIIDIGFLISLVGFFIPEKK